MDGSWEPLGAGAGERGRDILHVRRRRFSRRAARRSGLLSVASGRAAAARPSRPAAAAAAASAAQIAPVSGRAFCRSPVGRCRYANWPFRLRDATRLGVDVTVILTPPCIFVMENH